MYSNTTPKQKKSLLTKLNGKMSHITFLCAILLCAAIYLQPKSAAVDSVDVLMGLETLHGKFMHFAIQNGIEVEYNGLLARPTGREGMLTEKCGQWLFYSKIRKSAIRLHLCRSDERPDCTFRIENVAFAFRFEEAYVDVGLTNNRIEAFGCSATEFESEIRSIENIIPDYTR